jgi:predicted transcriptional regulator
MKKIISVMSLCLFLLFGFGGSVFANEAVSDDSSRHYDCKFKYFGHNSIGAMHETMMKELLGFLKLDEETFKQKVKEGKTWGQIAKEQGVSEQALVDFRLKQANAKLDAKVKEGVITVEQADKMKLHIKQNSKNFLNRVPMSKHYHGKFNSAIREDLLKFLKLDQKQFADKLKSGKTLLQIAEEQGITKQDLMKFYMVTESKMLDKGVSEGKLTKDQADKMKKSFEVQLNSFLRK